MAQDDPTLSPEGPDMSDLSPLQQQHEMSRARYGVLKEASSRLDLLRRELDKLTLLGDTVSPEDVVKGASALVASGVDPHELAVILSSMPTAGGEQLQQWVAMHDQETRQAESQLGASLSQARHEMGVDALHVLMEHHMTGGQPPTAARPSVGMPAPQVRASMGLGAPSPPASPGLTASSPTMGSA